MSDVAGAAPTLAATVARLFLYPVKGCRGIPLRSAELVETGLQFNGIGDREWVVVDADGEFLSQRELPKMTLIGTHLTSRTLRLTAPGMLTLEVPFASEGDVMRVRVWNDAVDAVTQGTIADQWFSDFLGTRARLMRFDPLARRVSSRKFTGQHEAPYKFADAFALLVASEASLADLNARLRRAGHAEVDIDRFRPNIVLAGVEAFDEDHASELAIGDARLQFVKPCVRCTVPSVDPATGEQGAEPGATLAAYRTDPRAGGMTFGMNAVVTGGAGAVLRAGDAAQLSLRF
jgi:uncharacterized protein YcbX